MGRDGGNGEAIKRRQKFDLWRQNEKMGENGRARWGGGAGAGGTRK